jgi:hypothetical protein
MIEKATWDAEVLLKEVPEDGRKIWLERWNHIHLYIQLIYWADFLMKKQMSFPIHKCKMQIFLLFHDLYFPHTVELNMYLGSGKPFLGRVQVEIPSSHYSSWTSLPQFPLDDDQKALSLQSSFQEFLWVKRSNSYSLTGHEIKQSRVLIWLLQLPGTESS